ncbi:hypothetical protein BJY04DRAFT_26499 [Aspergillus karnatakaensis]|uniref:uncharacterized protein n=1 Tax=Aspergillus karnatakaensis TaxID=1810916 RepID=UPI003CCD2749
MRLHSLPLLRGAITLAFPLSGSFTVAQECTASHNFTISSQEQLNRITSNCTEITGELSLVDYSGSLTLRNITRIQSIVLYPGSSLTELDLPELEIYEDNLILTGLDDLRRVSAPKLRGIEALHVAFTGDEVELSVPALSNVSSVFLRGNFKSQTFDSLRYVRTKFDICNAINCENFSYMNATTSMDLSFPALERIGNFQVGGNVTRLSTPEVTAITCSDCDWAALHLKLFGATPIAVDFPRLRTMEGNTYIRGDIASISLPALQEYTHEFIAIPHQALNITLPVQTGENFLFTGNVTEINLPNLRDFTRIHIDSDIKDFDCDELLNELKTTHSTPLNESTVDEYFQCSGVSPRYQGLGWIGGGGIALSVWVIIGMLV